jgi:hypothetical protein
VKGCVKIALFEIPPLVRGEANDEKFVLSNEKKKSESGRFTECEKNVSCSVIVERCECCLFNPYHTLSVMFSSVSYNFDTKFKLI